MSGSFRKLGLSSPPTNFGGLSLREHVAVWLLAATLYGQFIPLGSNSLLLGAAAATADIICAIVVFALLSPGLPTGFWGAIAWPAALFLLAFGWAAAGLLPIPAETWATGFKTVAGARTASLLPDSTIVELSKLGGAGALVLAGALIGARGRRLQAALSAVLAGGAIYTALALGLYSFSPDEVFGVSKGAHQWRFTATLLNGNAAGCALAALIALAAGNIRLSLNKLAEAPSGLKTQPAQELALTTVYLFVFAAACGMTRSRAALACAVAAVLIVALWPGRRPVKRRGRSRFLGYGGLCGLLLTAAVAAGVMFSGARTFERTEDLRAGLLDRAAAYARIVEDLRRAPWFGYGLGSFTTVNLHDLRPSEVMTVWNFRAAHDAALQAALEGGLPFLFLLATILAILVAKMAISSRSSAYWPVRRSLVAAGLVLLACSSIDIALNVPAVAALAMVLAGFALGGSHTPRQERPLGWAATRPRGPQLELSG